MKLLKEARFSAEEELKAFRAKEEERFKIEVEQVGSHVNRSWTLGTTLVLHRTGLIHHIVRPDRMKGVQRACIGKKEESPFASSTGGCFLAQRLGQDDSLTNELADRTKSDIEIIKNDFVTNKDGVLAFISEKVLSVDTVVGPRRVAVLRDYARRGIDP